ncbi:hypothetical protein ACFLYB_06780 [Chloroflexota bacterium]
MAAYNTKNMLVAVRDIGDREKASHFGVVSLNGYRILAIEEKPAVASTRLKVKREIGLRLSFCGKRAESNM